MKILLTNPAIPFLLSAVISLSCGPKQAMMTHRNHSFENMDFYVKNFENPARLKWQKPDEVVRAMSLKNGDIVADIGAGTGYFARRIALAVAPRGSITGYDTEIKMVEYMREDARRLGYTNYHAEPVPRENPSLPAGRFDVIFMCNTYHHIENRVAYLKSVRPSLKKTGRFVLIDARMEAKDGPPKRFRIPRDIIEAEFKEAGFVTTKYLDFLPDQHYLEFSMR